MKYVEQPLAYEFLWLANKSYKNFVILPPDEYVLFSSDHFNLKKKVFSKRRNFVTITVLCWS